AAALADVDLGALLADEPTLAVPQEHPAAAAAGEGHQVESAVAVEVPRGEGGDAVLALFAGERPAFPAEGPRVHHIDAAPPHLQLAVEVAYRKIVPPVAVE